VAPVDAARIARTGKYITAERCRHMRLVDDVRGATALMPHALEVTRMIGRHPPTAVRVEMQALDIGEDKDHHNAARFGQRLSC
jgi:E-phenylitaconyl-CoA hydratase